MFAGLIAPRASVWTAARLPPLWSVSSPVVRPPVAVRGALVWWHFAVRRPVRRPAQRRGGGTPLANRACSNRPGLPHMRQRLGQVLSRGFAPHSALSKHPSPALHWQTKSDQVRPLNFMNPTQNVKKQTMDPFCPVTSGEWHVTRNLTRAGFFLSPVTRHASPVGGSQRPGADISPSPVSRFTLHASTLQPAMKITKQTQIQNAISRFKFRARKRKAVYFL